MGILVVGMPRNARQFSTAELNLLSAVGNQIAATIDKSLLLEEDSRGIRKRCATRRNSCCKARRWRPSGN